MSKTENRFVVMKKERFDSFIGGGEICIMVDRITGVNYIVIKDLSTNMGANSFAITPLLKADGKPAISDVSKL